MSQGKTSAMSISRRAFMYFLGAGTAVNAGLRVSAQSTARESSKYPFTPLPRDLEMVLPHLPSDIVILSSNENPLGPSKHAIEFMASMGSLCARYDRATLEKQCLDTVSAKYSLKLGYVAMFPGADSAGQNLQVRGTL